MIENQNEKELEFDLTYYLDMVLRRRWIVLSVWVAVIITTALVTFITRPVYQAQALLTIEKGRVNDEYYQTQYKLLKSQVLLDTVYKRLDLGKYPEFANLYGYPKLIKLVDVDPVPRSSLVYIKANAYDPLLASQISNMVANVYIEQNLSNQPFISKDVLAALQGGKNGNQRAVFDSLPAVGNNVLIQDLKREGAKLQAQLADATGRYTPKHPQVVSLAANLKAVQDQIRAETDNIIKSLKIDLSDQLMGNDIRLIEAAMPPLKPIKPRKAFNMLLALFGGFVLGLFAAVLVEFIDQTIHTQEDVENKLGLPFLGVVPMTPFSKKTTAYSHMLVQENSLISESIRNLRTMLDFAIVGQKNKSFIVTSTVQGEGKSYVCANLAVAIAQAGEKVLVVDGNLRRSSLHKNFRVSNSKGLSEFLAGGRNTDELKALVQQSDVPNLSILTCGPRPSNPAELLNTPRLGTFLAWAGEYYDRVIIDCPPMFPISDVLLWSKYMSSVVYVTSFGKIRVPLIKNGTKRLQAAGIKILGGVVNMSKFGGLYYSYYGCSQYNYHYAADDKEESDKHPRDEKKDSNKQLV